MLYSHEHYLVSILKEGYPHSRFRLRGNVSMNRSAVTAIVSENVVVSIDLECRSYTVIASRIGKLVALHKIKLKLLSGARTMVEARKTDRIIKTLT